MFYLQKVIAFIESGSCTEENSKKKNSKKENNIETKSGIEAKNAEENGTTGKYAEELNVIADLAVLGCTLQREGISFQCLVGKSIAECELALQFQATAETLHHDEEKRLWITDSAAFGAKLRAQGEAVLALLHERNRNADFSGILYACENPAELDGEYMDRVYCRYAGLPWDIAETDRCFIRETTVADVEAFFEMYSRPELTKYTEGLYPTVEQEQQYVRDYIEKVYGFYGFGVWTIVKKDSGEIIGRAGFSYREGYEEPEIGFVIGLPWQRQGYAEEVCRCILEYGEEALEFDTVQAFVMPENVASVNLCGKLGLHKIGTEEIKGVLYDRFIRSKLRKEI